jgi:hypothetical protein
MYYLFTKYRLIIVDALLLAILVYLFFTYNSNAHDGLRSFLIGAAAGLILLNIGYIIYLIKFLVKPKKT